MGWLSARRFVLGLERVATGYGGVSAIVYTLLAASRPEAELSSFANNLKDVAVAPLAKMPLQNNEHDINLLYYWYTDNGLKKLHAGKIMLYSSRTLRSNSDRTISGIASNFFLSKTDTSA